MIEQINEIALIWWNWMWPMFWQVSLLIAIVGAVDILLRKRIWPQLRYALWLLVLVKLVLPPTFALPTALVPRLGLLAERPAATQVVMNLDHSADKPLLATSSAEVGRFDLTTEENLPAVSAEATVAPVLWRALVLIIWLLGGLALTLWLILGYIRLSRVYCEKIEDDPLPESLSRLLSDTAEKLRLRRLPRVVVSPKIDSPAVFGVFRPVLLLPANRTMNLSEQETTHVLLHELTHVKRKDLQVHAFCVLIQIVYWFNPLVYLVRHHLQHVRELCCDATVAKILRDQTQDYCQTILETAAWLLNRPSHSGIGFLGLVENPGRLLVRLSWLRKGPSKHPRLRWATVSILVVTMFACVLPMAQAQQHRDSPGNAATDTGAETFKSLHEAAKAGKVAEVKRQIAKGADVNATEAKTAWTPLMYAADGGHTEVVRTLLASGAKVDMANPNGLTPLALAIISHQEETVETLISAGADVNKACGEKLGHALPLNFAIWHGKLRIAEFLLGAGADVDRAGFGGHTSLHHAAFLAYRHNPEMVELILSRKPETVFTAACKGELDKVKTLMAGGLDVNAKDELDLTLLHWAAIADSPEVADFLIAQGADVNAKSKLNDRTPLMSAHSLPVIRLLVSKGADVNAQQTNGWTRLHLACFTGDKDTADFLIRQGADVNLRDNAGLPALWLAVSVGHAEVVELLIANGANVNLTSNEGSTLLWAATLHKHPDVVKLLIAKGIDVNAAGRALDLAEQKGYTEIVELLKNHKVKDDTNVSSQNHELNKALFKAVKVGDMLEIERLIAEGADINANAVGDTRAKQTGWTVLLEAATRGHTEVARLLIKNGADVNAGDSAGFTPLYYAIWDGNKDMVDFLVGKGAETDLMPEGEYSPLHYAIWEEDFDLVKLLVEKEARFDLKGGDGLTAIHCAASQRNRDIIELFISKGVDTSSFHLAAFVGDLARVKELLQEGTAVDTKDEAGWTALFWAACSGQTNVAKFLIDNNADVNAKGRGQSPLHQAVQKNAIELAELLVLNGAIVDAKDGRGNTPLHGASHRDVAAVLIAKGADVNAKNRFGTTPLHNAASEGRMGVGELLIEKGADVNAKNKWDLTCLDIATNQGHTGIAQLLRKHGATTSVDKSAASFDQAVSEGDIELVKSLLAKGADVNGRGRRGLTILHIAASHGHKVLVELLITKGADVNATGPGGGTALHGASRFGHRDVVELLMTKGADVNAKRYNGQTPLSVAKEQGHEEIAEILRQHGGKE